jgi:hypothetical protein
MSFAYARCRTAARRTFPLVFVLVLSPGTPASGDVSLPCDANPLAGCDAGFVDAEGLGLSARGCGCRQPGCGGSKFAFCENFSIFLGLDGSKQPQDFGVNAHFGGRLHANLGIPLLADQGLGLQIGAALNATENAVQVVERVEGSKRRTQFFSTVGLFQRAGCGLNWALVYDFLNQDYFDSFSLSQWRGHLGYWCNDCAEIGIRAALSDRNDAGLFGTIPVVLDPISQVTLYGRKVWPKGAVTGVWAGVAEGHNEPNVALGDLSPIEEPFVFGADVFCPLTNRLAIYGEANFIRPADTGTVDAYLGIVFYPVGHRRAFRRPFAPVLPVANNTSMSVDLWR